MIYLIMVPNILGRIRDICFRKGRFAPIRTFSTIPILHHALEKMIYCSACEPRD